jgi:phage gpG-like protein
MREPKINARQYQAYLEAEMKKRLSASAITLQNHIKVMIGTEGAGKAASSKTLRGGRKQRKGSLIYGANPSAPGNPPHKQTGTLQRSIAWELVGLKARVGSNIKYSRHLELGTTHMAARPYLIRGLNEMQAQIAAILTKPIK